eukprot:TRINITY_DN10385_c0_g1_i1.p1 TRINITY_DN10385_c0_g1~~TRINITY_DN10385_c0_g1_i1.p1  ORF type:complete len:337 (+),score=43.02 TRINITY_DN10385_c0_g1_i1:75-1085(+)
MKSMMLQLVKGAKPEDLNFRPPLDAGLQPIAEVLRTEDSRFAGLKDYPFRPNYIMSHSHSDVRIHYVDEGPRDAADTVLLMHGEPSWSYLYRHMIPPLVAQGFRVVAPDLVGFGRSDKPTQKDDYSYERHVQWMSDFLVGVGLKNVTLFCQDWGGLIGLRLVAKFPERFLRLVIANTGLPTGGGQVNQTFRVWAGVVSQKLPNWKPVLQSGTDKKLSPEELDAYMAPYPSERFMAGSRQLPRIVPQFDEHASVEENRGAWRRVFHRWHKPILTLFSDNDAVTKGAERAWIGLAGAKGQPHTIVPGGHFLQEDCPDELVRRITAFIKANPPKAGSKL